MVTAFGHYEKGFLPEPGGWLDQAATYCEAMRFLVQRVNEHMDPKRNG